MPKSLFFFILVFALVGLNCKSSEFKSPTIQIKTIFGDIYVELYPDKAPKTVAGFLSYVDSGYFKETSFYRELKKEDQPTNAFKSEIIQGGLWKSNLEKQQTIPGIPHESTKETGLLHKAGIISLARSEPGTASTEFFICLTDLPVYDYGGGASPEEERLGFSAFGKVVKGFDVIKQIYAQPDLQTHFKTPVRIFNIVRAR
ncbi:MAG: peptidylprolyl isomerase [Ginsengibacter sp.]